LYFGIYKHNGSCSSKPDDANHAMNAAGYGVDKSGQEFYILRSSWGSDWGEGNEKTSGSLNILINFMILKINSGGYMKIARNKNNI
jgi:hypothetical protein